MSDTADELMDKYEISDADANQLDVKVWAHEAFEFSKSDVYPHIEKNKMPSNEYIENARAIAERQVVLGGHRLANMLKSLKLKAPEKPKSYFERFGEYFGISEELNDLYNYFMQQ